MRRAVLVLVAAAALAGLATAPARADGDPASDVLYFQDVFLPYTQPTAALAKSLTSTVAAANKAGFRIKVVLIESPQDLGSVPSLFNHQDVYARFLGTELQQFYTQRLLVVMPAGFGVYHDGKSTSAETAALAGIAVAPPGDSDALATAAIAAVQKLHKVLGAIKGKDAIAPAVKALTSSGAKGKPAKLRFTVYDASGKSREIVRVYGPSYLLFATIATRFGKAKPKQTTSVTWKVPADLQTTKLQFCILAQDPTGNQSVTSCAPLKIT
ncbi:MAG TPA: hypothetical protein VLJ76_06595 [Gaiellaceae bacterium]|nr:hypothetical protein [Gaiellaceae bacterium]